MVTHKIHYLQMFRIQLTKIEKKNIVASPAETNSLIFLCTYKLVRNHTIPKTKNIN